MNELKIDPNIGLKFGDVTIIEYIRRDKYNFKKYKYKCICGRTGIATISTIKLQKNNCFKNKGSCVKFKRNQLSLGYIYSEEVFNPDEDIPKDNLVMHNTFYLGNIGYHEFAKTELESMDRDFYNLTVEIYNYDEIYEITLLKEAPKQLVQVIIESLLEERFLGIKKDPLRICFASYDKYDAIKIVKILKNDFIPFIKIDELTRYIIARYNTKLDKFRGGQISNKKRVFNQIHNEVPMNLQINKELDK